MSHPPQPFGPPSDQRKRRHTGSSGGGEPARRACPSLPPSYQHDRPLVHDGHPSASTRSDLTTAAHLSRFLPPPQPLEPGNLYPPPLDFSSQMSSSQLPQPSMQPPPPRRVSDIFVPRWQPDYEVDGCTVCRTPFNFLNRRHHCRKCGRVVCGNCSTHRITIPREYIVTQDGSTSAAGGGQEVRVCNPCVPDPWTPPTPSQPGQDGRRDSEDRVRHGLSVEGAQANNVQRLPPFRFPVGQEENRWTASMPRPHRNSATFDSQLQDQRALAIFPPFFYENRARSNSRDSHLAHNSPPFPSRATPLHLPRFSAGFFSDVDPRSSRALPPPPPPPSSALRPTPRGLPPRPPDVRLPSHPIPGRPLPPRPGSERAPNIPFTRPTSAQPIRPQRREEDYCPICGRLLPAGAESEREAHVMACIQSHSSLPRSLSTPAAAVTAATSSTPPPPPPPAAARPRAESHQSQRQSPQAPSAPAPQQAAGRRGLVEWQASEKDCMPDDAGAAPECVICLEEFAPGGVLVRLECWCKFHRDCLAGWWKGRNRGCPTHRLSEGD